MKIPTRPMIALIPLTFAQAAHADLTAIDLLVLHTPAVTSNFGGESGVAAHAMASVEASNQALEDSDISLRFRLVAVEEIAYSESSTQIGDDLNAISGQGSGDPGVHDEASGLRDAHGADWVAHFRDGAVGGSAGIAFNIDPENDSASFGYAVVSDAAALSNLTLAHELGHNLASGHARGESGSEPPIDAGRGHKFTANGTDYRTIMSIDSDYSRVARYSNPQVTFEGVATGVSADDPGAADNATVFAISGPVVAGFRLEQTAVPTFLDEPLGATVVAGGDARLRAGVRGFPPLEVDWFLGAVGDTSEPLVSSENALERGGTESTVALDGVAGTTPVWLRVSNPNDTLESRNFRVVAVPEPGGPIEPVVAQAQRDGGLVLSFAFEQDMTVSPASYLKTIRLILARDGDPPDPTVRFEEVGGAVIFERPLDASAVEPWPAQSEQDLPVGVFAAPGTLYRVTVTPGAGQDGQNRILWHFAEPASVSDPDVGDSNLTSNRRLMFSLLGTPAWTYHTWLEDESPDPAAIDPNPASETGGLPNLLRYAFGGSFGDPASGLRPQLLPLESGPEGMEAPFRFTQRAELADVALVVEKSSDLGNWTAVDAAAVDFLGETTAGEEAWEARVPFEDDQMFLRLNALNPPPAP